jgi:hypothetical protein
MAAENTETKANGKQPNKTKQPRVISHPSEIAGLVMMQIDQVNSKKDELTIAIKTLADTSKQLVRAYAQQQAAIQKLQKRVQELEKNKEK